MKKFECIIMCTNTTGTVIYIGTKVLCTYLKWMN